MPATKKLTASRAPRLACEGAGPALPKDAVVTVIFFADRPPRVARENGVSSIGFRGCAVAGAALVRLELSSHSLSDRPCEITTWGRDRPRRAWGRSRRPDFGRGGPQTGRAFTLLMAGAISSAAFARSEERRVGKECRSAAR